LARSKKEASPPLTRVSFDPTQMEKIATFDVFRANFPNLNQIADPTRVKSFDPDPSLPYPD